MRVVNSNLREILQRNFGMNRAPGPPIRLPQDGYPHPKTLEYLNG